MDKHALLASITHQLTLLARAVDQPDSGAAIASTRAATIERKHAAAVARDATSKAG